MNTKALMILGALVGFLIGAACGLASDAPLPTTLWRACAGALIAAVLTRWWGSVWINGLKDSLEQRQAQRQAAAQAKNGAKS